MTDRNVDPYCKGVDKNGYHDPLTRMKLSQQLVSNEFPFFTSIFRCVTLQMIKFLPTQGNTTLIDKSIYSSTCELISHET